MSDAAHKAGDGQDGGQNEGQGRAVAFAMPVEQTPRRGLWIAVASALVIALVAGALLLRSHAGAGSDAGVRVNQLLPVDAYAPKLALSELAMSQSSSLSGGTSTFIDGKVKNTGDRTITAITVQVPFGNDEGLSPQVETVPMTLIRMREPYIDTEPVSAAPLKPGDEREFRLIFENIPANWNQQLPEIHVVKTSVH